jgi:hypothetical protein
MGSGGHSVVPIHNKTISYEKEKPITTNITYALRAKLCNASLYVNWSAAKGYSSPHFTPENRNPRTAIRNSTGSTL